MIQRCACGTCRQEDPGTRGYIWTYHADEGVWVRSYPIKQ
jgi:hypothetical protein